MNYNDVIRKIVGDYMRSYGLTDMCIGKVHSIDPISISLNDSLDSIPASNIKLTNSVIEKTIDIVEHSHSYFDSDTGEGAGGSETRQTDTKLQNVQVYENGKPLGRTQDGLRLIINKKLEVGDLVLCLLCKNNQELIVLSRLY